MSILPQSTIDINTIIETTKQSITLPLFKEYAWNFAENKFLLQNGKPIIIEGIEALKVWVYKALLTERYKYLAYSWNYGSELKNLIGIGYTSIFKSETKRYLEEALMINPYITGITNINASFVSKKLSVDFTVQTVYGEVNISV